MKKRHPAKKTGRSAPPNPSQSDRPKKSGERPLREDLVTQAVLEAWGSIWHEKRLADRALDFTLRHKAQLYSNERRAVAERVYAMLRRQRTLDFLLQRTRPGFDALPKTSQDVLRLAASRVLHGESGLKIRDQLGLEFADSRAIEMLPDAASELEKMPREKRFPIAASLPDFVAKKFLEQFGNDAERAAEAMNERAPLFGRVNTLKGTREELLSKLNEENVRASPGKLSPLAVELDTRQNAFSLKSFQEGLFELQDEGSQLLGMLVDPPPTKNVDACAGAGGKTLQLAAEMKNRGDLFAFDIEERRMEDLRRRARRAGVHNVRVRVIPADETANEAIADLAGKIDRVLVDAPCSGSGTFRRKPDARYRMTEEFLREHVERQKMLLSRFSALVKPGGRLIYGTCSVLREENEDVVEHFLKAHPDFTVRHAEEELGKELGDKVTRNGFLRLFPHLHGTDGFFGAILVRNKK
ncbi:MAG: RsmB/NOP family class I SAM-dependent RNA methyltransferase [Myxococcaceae bacterium]